jgi:membrane-bound serine protease (ClpP class)
MYVHRREIYRTLGRTVRRCFSICLCLVGVFLLGAGDGSDKKKAETARDAAAGAAPADATTRAAYLVRIPLPIAGNVDTQVEQMVSKLLERMPAGEQRPVLIFEFSAAEGQSGEGSKFERALSLARFLSGQDLSRVRTVAYLPNSVQGHAVLAVMACEEIIMHPDAKLGLAGIDEAAVDATMRSAYTEIAERRRTIPVPVALGMLDKQLAVYKVQSLDGVRYVLGDEYERMQQAGNAPIADTVIPPGELGNLSGFDLRNKYQIASHLAADRRELATALRLPPGAIIEDPSLGGEWQALLVELRGPVNASYVNRIIRGIEDGRRDHEINFICVWIESPGGSPAESVRLANHLAAFDPAEVRTVAYIPNEARSDAALVALACDQIVMDKEAKLGGPGARIVSPRMQKELRTPMQALAASKHRDWSLTAALVDPQLTVHEFRRPGTGEVRYFCDEELAAQKDKEVWQRGAAVETREGLTGRKAEDLKLVRHLAASYTELRALYNLNDELKPVEANRFVVAIERLASQPWFPHTLLFIGFFALLSEASAPGVGVPGFVSALCFLLFFWSQFLNGTADWLEVLLFVAGVVFVMLEIFVIPGFGIFGLGGGVMIIISIVLASQTFVIPQNSYQFGQLPGSLFTIVMAGGGALTALFVMYRFLPNTPYLNRLMLKPPEGDRLDELAQRESLVEWNHLMGKRGVTSTPLMPAGKARFGDDIVDVTSDGDFISRGTDVYVTEVRGNHVVVRAIEGKG